MTKELKKLLDFERNQGIQNYLRSLNMSATSNYSLWKATKKFKCPQQQFLPIKKQDGNWARSDQEKAETFASHLTKVFTPNPRVISQEEEIALLAEHNDINIMVT